MQCAGDVARPGDGAGGASDHGAGGMVHVSVLGDLRASRGSRELELGAPKHRAVLAALAMAEGRPVGVEALGALVWSEDQPPANPTSALHVYVSALRRVVEDPRAAGVRPQALVTTPGGYRLDPSHVRVDAAELVEVATRSRGLLRAAEGEVVPDPALPAPAMESLLAEVERALGTWRGDPFPELQPTVGVSAARVRLEAARTSLLEDRAVLHLGLGRPAEVSAQLGELLVERPLDERLWLLHALALARSDRQAEALAAIRTIREHLADELGIDPGPALRALEGMVLRQDPAVRGARAPVPRVPGTTDGERSAYAADEHASTAITPVAARLVGREAELAALREQLAAGGTRIVQLVGEAGIGKSTLAAELASAARSAGELVGVARCPEDEGAPPLWPWTELVSELTDRGGIPRDLPDPLRAPTAELADAEVARFRLFEAFESLLDSVATRRRCVLVLEDLHWADSATARLLAHLVTAWAAGGRTPDLLLLVTRRPEADARPASAAAWEALARYGTLRIDLAGLSVAEVTSLARDRTSWSIDRATSTTLHERTRGNPFLVGELLRLGEGAFRAGEVPAGVADVVRRRVAGLPDPTRAALATAAVVGRTFELEVVAAAIGDPSGADDLLDTLDPALAAGLLVDEGADRMSFAHALTRDAVHGAIALARRARQHARVAEVLEQHAPWAVARSAETARHWLAAGPRYADRAWRAARAAASDVGHRIALDEAADLLEAALLAQDDDLAATVEDRTDLALLTARSLLLAGRWTNFVSRVDEAASRAETEGDPERAARFAIMPAEAGPWTPRAFGTVDPTAVARLRRLLERLPAEDAELRCRAMLALGSELYFNPGSALERQALVDEGLAMARRLGDPALLGRISQRAALVIWRGGNAVARLELAGEAVDAAVAAGDVDLLQTSLELRMSAALEAGAVDLMLADVARATELTQQRPTVYHTVVVACLVVPWLAAQSRFEEAQDRLRAAARLASGTQLPWAGLALGTAAQGLALWRGDEAAVDDDPLLGSFVAEVEPALPSVGLLRALRAGDVLASRESLAALPWLLTTDDFTSLFHQAIAAEAAYVVEDAALGAEAYAALAGQAGRIASAGTGIPLGPVDAYLALAAAATGDLVRAAEHADQAERLVETWGLVACGAWLRARRARGGW